MKFIPVLILMGFWIFRLAVHFIKHGEKRELEYSYPGVIITMIISWSLYYWAGLFDVFTNQ